MSRSCRECRFFFRVRKRSDKIENLRNCQGFCIHGQLDGSYSLYCSSSVSMKCKAFVVSGTNKQVMGIEDTINAEYHEFQRRCHDNRTKEYKVLKNKYINDAEIKKLLDTIDDDIRFYKMMINHDIQKAIQRIFYKRYEKLYEELSNSDYVDYTEYLELMSNISRTMFEKWFGRERKDDYR